MRVEPYTVVWRGGIGPSSVQVNQALGWAEIELNGQWYQILGDAENPNLLFHYTDKDHRAVATLETVLRSIARCPAPKLKGEPDEFNSKLESLKPVMAAYRKAKALAERFSEHWREAENADEIKIELRRRYDEATEQQKATGRPGWEDDRVALGAWLGAEATLGKPAREILRDKF